MFETNKNRYKIALLLIVTSFFLVLAFTHYYPGDNRSDTTPTKIITKQLPRKSNRKPVRLSSCEVVLQLETLPAGNFAGRLFASLVVLLCTL